jgi:CheY-like chemotaxis protein
MRILVVDDNIIDRRFIKYSLLTHLNISADTAKDGLEALTRIKKEYFDLVITDIVMPKIEGIELINHIQTLSPTTKIIAVSGNNPYYLYIVKKLGIDSVFTKPIENAEFIERVKTIMCSPANIKLPSKKSIKVT